MVNPLVNPPVSNKCSEPIHRWPGLNARGHKTKAMEFGKRFVEQLGAGRGGER